MKVIVMRDRSPKVDSKQDIRGERVRTLGFHETPLRAVIADNLP
ncbi:hypothetical protein [Myxococcus sp. CA056]|nr:hypothetical protein [Myxococcus sp. CA056]